MNTKYKVSNYYTLYKLCTLRQEFEDKLLKLDNQLRSIPFCENLRTKAAIRLKIQEIGERIRTLDETIKFIEEATRKLWGK